MDIKSNSIYSNGKILFSGLVENRNGIWSYDIESENLVCELEVDDKTFFEPNLNLQKDKIVLSGYNNENGSNKYTLNVGLIDENLEISNLSNVFSIENNNGSTMFEGWSEDGNSFYMSSRVNHEGSSSIYNYYEVYEIMN